MVDARQAAETAARPAAPKAPTPAGGRGPFGGKGPRGYRRSDARIREDICDALLADPEIDASDIDVQVSDGEVTFEGAVSDRLAKHYVECIGAECLGVVAVQNNLHVAGMRRRAARDEPVGPPLPPRVDLEFDPAHRP